MAVFKRLVAVVVATTALLSAAPPAHADPVQDVWCLIHWSEC